MSGLLAYLLKLLVSKYPPVTAFARIHNFIHLSFAFRQLIVKKTEQCCFRSKNKKM